MDLLPIEKIFLIDILFDKEVKYSAENLLHEKLVKLGKFLRVSEEEDNKLFITGEGVSAILDDIPVSRFGFQTNPSEPVYTAKIIKEVILGKPYWKTLIVGVFYEGKLVGKYYRNYASLMKTFCPFLYKDQWFALYSPKYTATRLMKLPECQDIGGEPPVGNGFCPVDFHVPHNPKTGKSEGFGFVAGCIWGDDTSWKIEFLDLRESDKGIVKRDARFGYIELPDDCSLADAIMLDSFWWWDLNDDRAEEKILDPVKDNRWIKIKIQEHFKLGSGKKESDDDDD
jgi:hypothetical protein